MSMLPHSRWSGRVAMPRGPGWVNSGQGGVAACLTWCNGLTSNSAEKTNDFKKSTKECSTEQEPLQTVNNSSNRNSEPNIFYDPNRQAQTFGRQTETGSQTHLIKNSSKLFAEDKVIEAVQECLAKGSPAAAACRPEMQRRPPKPPSMHYNRSLNFPCYSKPGMINRRRVEIAQERHPPNLTIVRPNTPQVNGTKKSEPEVLDRKLQRPSTAPSMRQRITTFDGSVTVEPGRPQTNDPGSSNLSVQQATLVNKVRRSEERFNRLLEQLQASLRMQQMESRSGGNKPKRKDDLWKMSKFTENAKPKISTRWGRTPTGMRTPTELRTPAELQRFQDSKCSTPSPFDMQQSRPDAISQGTQTQLLSSRPGSTVLGQSVLNRVNLQFECEPDSDTLVNLRLKTSRAT